MKLVCQKKSEKTVNALSLKHVLQWEPEWLFIFVFRTTLKGIMTSRKFRATGQKLLYRQIWSIFFYARDQSFYAASRKLFAQIQCMWSLHCTHALFYNMEAQILLLWETMTSYSLLLGITIISHQEMMHLSGSAGKNLLHKAVHSCYHSRVTVRGMDSSILHTCLSWHLSEEHTLFLQVSTLQLQTGMGNQGSFTTWLKFLHSSNAERQQWKNKKITMAQLQKVKWMARNVPC